MIELTPQAEEDLESIYEYTYDRWGEAAANAYQDDLFFGMVTIAKNNEIGVQYPYLSGGYRKYQVRRHLNFYRNEISRVVVIRILHERMDTQERL